MQESLKYSRDQSLDTIFLDNDNGKESAANNYSEYLMPKKLAPWKLIIIDDEEVIHQVTSMVLKDLSYNGRELEILNGYSGTEAMRLIKDNPDTAMIMLDVVMETDCAGLDVVKYIRTELKNNLVRIILRTGQPGHAPEDEVIANYDVNDYKEKSDLTPQKLKTTVLTALRSFQDMNKLHELVILNDVLQSRIKQRANELFQKNNELLLEIKERTESNIALEKSQACLAEAQTIANIGNWEWNLVTNKMSWSDQVYRILRLDQQQFAVSVEALLEMVDKDQRENVANAYNGMAAFDIEHHVNCRDGIVRIVHQQARVDYDTEGCPFRMAGTIQDITERHQAENKMRKLSAAIEQTADSVMITDCSGFIEYVNPSFEVMTGYSRDEMTGSNPSLLKSGKQSPDFYQRLWETILAGEVFRDVIINRKKNGLLYHEEKTISPQKDANGNVTHFISTGKDVSARMEVQSQLEYLAHHDSLTGLPNRVLLQDRLDQLLARSRWSNRNIAILFLDLDRFKIINDTLGHDVGDKLLKRFSERLKLCVREGDTVARLGGDEFSIILNDVASQDDVEPIARKILTILEEPFYINSHEMFVTASIGISLFPFNGDDSKTLMKKADVAMYRSKEAGRNNFQFYSEEDDVRAVERLSMETSLRRALERDEFSLDYQPQLDLNSGKIIGMEALLRWSHPEFKNVSPFHFIPLLEETGLIIPVGEWVLRKACMQTKALHNSGNYNYRVAVNLSIRQFKANDLVKSVENILKETGLDPGYLELEITEGLLIDQIDETSKVLNEMHEMGVKLSIDDFGTGYSSMNYLKKLPFDQLKIDKSFIKDVCYNPDDAAISIAIITMAQSMGLEVIAEGVETVDQLDFMYTQGCDAIQGYLCSPPLPPEGFEKLVNENQNMFLDAMLIQGSKARA